MDSRHVLAIEHDWRMRKLIRVNLEATGIGVQEAVSVQHGLQLLRDSQPDLIVVDLDLPDTDALHLLGMLRPWLGERGIPIIVLSAEPLERKLGSEGYWTSHLQKPFAVLALIQQVRKALLMQYEINEEEW
jgi:DNA-binding response OmpR family regulator